MIRILIADDHALIRAGLREVLSSQPRMHVIEAESGQEVIRKLGALDIHIVLLDISMPGKSGMEILKDIKNTHPKIPVLMLSVHSEEEYAIRALKAGASGYITKDGAPKELVAAIETVLSGKKYISPTVAEKLIGELGDKGKLPHDLLSDREYEVLRSMSAGLTTSEIAEKLFLSPKTVSTYRTRILEKLGLHSNADIIRYAIEHGIG